MPPPDSPPWPEFAWLRELGLGARDLRALNPCVPGEFTVAGAHYINTATPGQVYVGTEEGTLPMVDGRWFLISRDVLDRFPALRRDAARVARAVRLTRGG